MAYVTLLDLPEIQSTDINGNEYIMVTDEIAGVSSKFTVDSMVIYVGEHFDNTVDSKLAFKVDKILGKGLSTEDFSTLEKQKLESLDNYIHPESGVLAGSYTKVTVDSLGHITTGSNPDTLLGYGITDAINSSNLGQPGGVATLDENGVVNLSQIPVNILEYNTTTSFPITGEYNKIYISLDTNKLYRWTGVIYTQLGSLVNSVAGRTGSIILSKADVYLTNVDNTSDINKPISTATQTALNLKANINSPTLVTPNIGVATGTSFNSITGLASVAPLIAGTAAVGTSTLTARQDHVHPAQTTISGNAGTATTLATARNITLSGDASGTASFNGSADASIVVVVADNSHAHTIANVTGLQTELDNKVDDNEKGSANGVATLDTNGKVTLTQIPDSVLGQLEYQGVWDFTTLPTATQKGQYWIASVSGNGYVVGDWAVWNGLSFDKLDNTDAVASVSGRTGNVVLTKSDVGLNLVDNIADINKNVLSATKWTTPRNIALTGDVTGNVNIDGSENVSIATTIALNSVALGTDTTGNYVAGNTAGTGITVTGTAGEGWTPTIAIDSTVATLAGTQTLTNKTLQDSTTFIVDNTDATKKVQFDVAGVTTATTRTLTIPNVNGTIITTGDMGSITSSMILDGTIVNADINASAGILDTKLATISTAGKVANSATTATNLNTASTIVARDASGNFTAGIITASLNGNASTATTLQTARLINGVAFNGTANITIPTNAANISNVEFLNGNSRNGSPVYGIEVDIGSMPNTAIKNVSFTFNAAYTYWIDNQNSYCSNATASYPLNYAGNIGESISCYLDKTNNLIKILTSDDKSTFTGKLNLLYTK